ncbi:MAG TPA: nucleoside-diphosphate kinase, partial [Solirubrobacteraceae bacterium]|nr:nucleoside-diphosphate kinase [Solirubrobacteraceae bacterium]
MTAHDALGRCTVVPLKAARYADEAWFREAWPDVLNAAGEGALRLVHDHAAVLLKPDAFAGRTALAAVRLLAGAGFAPVAARRVEVGRHAARALWLYRFNVATADRIVLHDQIFAAGPSMLVVLRSAGDAGGVPATVRLTALKGSSRPERRSPEQLRSRLGVGNRLLNVLHTSDEPADLVRELAIFLDGAERRALLRELATVAGVREAEDA